MVCEQGAEVSFCARPPETQRQSKSSTMHFISTNEKTTFETEPRASFEGHCRRCGNELG